MYSRALEKDSVRVHENWCICGRVRVKTYKWIGPSNQMQCVGLSDQIELQRLHQSDLILQVSDGLIQDFNRILYLRAPESAHRVRSCEESRSSNISNGLYHRSKQSFPASPIACKKVPKSVTYRLNKRAILRRALHDRSAWTEVGVGLLSFDYELARMPKRLWGGTFFSRHVCDV